MNAREGAGPPHAIFLVVEGLDGAGKTTQIERLAAWFSARGTEPVVTREPGGTALGGAIRDLLLDPANRSMSPRTEALLYAADRAQHAAEVIRPALEAGKVVISDRYLDSSLAYQGLARGLGVEPILGISLWAVDGLLPDLVVLLDLPSDVGRARSGGTDRIEAEGEAFHRRVGRAYWALSRTYPHRFAVVDASAPPDAVGEAIRDRVEALLRERGLAPAGVAHQ